MSQNISIDLGQKYESLFGSHRTVKEKFLILKGKIIHKEGKTFFVDENGDGEELWKAIPYKVLSPGTNLGLIVSGPGITLITRGEILKKDQKKDGKASSTWFWKGPGEIIRFHSLLDRLSPFLQEGTQIEVIIWK